jgi:hypothetical protein
MRTKKAKAKLTAENIDKLIRGESIVISLKKGTEQLLLELIPEETKFSQQMIDEALNSLDEAVKGLEKVVLDTGKQTYNTFQSLKTTFSSIFKK